MSEERDIAESSSVGSRGSEATGSESTFDKLYQDYLSQPPNKLMRVKPPFVPVLYDAKDPPCKFRRLLARAHELEIREKLSEMGNLSQKKVDLYARNASYYPGTLGSRHQSLDRAFSFSLTPPRMSFSPDSSPNNYLFKDLSKELPRQKDARLSSPVRSATPIGDDYQTPKSSVGAVEHLSPVFDKMNTAFRRSCSEMGSTFSSEEPQNSPSLIHKQTGRMLFTRLSASSEDLSSSVQQQSLPELHLLPDIKNKRSDIGPQQKDARLSSPVRSAMPIGDDYQTPNSSVGAIEHLSPVFDKMNIKFRRSCSEMGSTEAMTEKIDRQDSRASNESIVEDSSTISEYVAASESLLVPRSSIDDWILSSGNEDSSASRTLMALRKAVETRHKLFIGYAFLCAKPFIHTITYDILVALLRHHGADVVDHPCDFEHFNENTIRVCLVGELEFYEIKENKRLLRRSLIRYNCKCVKVHYQWIFDVLQAKRIQPMIQHLFDSTIEDMRIAGVPEYLLFE